MTYEQFEVWRRRIGVSRAAMCQRALVNESTVFKGLREGRSPIRSIALRLKMALMEMEAERSAAARIGAGE